MTAWLLNDEIICLLVLRPWKLVACQRAETCGATFRAELFLQHSVETGCEWCCEIWGKNACLSLIDDWKISEITTLNDDIKRNVYLKHHLSTPTAMYTLVTWRYCSPHTMHYYICTSLYPYSPHHTDHYSIQCVLQKTHGYCAFVPPPQYNLLKLLKVGFNFITNL